MSKNLPANTAATAGSAEILVECITTIRGCRIRPSAVLWSAEDPQHDSHSALCKLTSSLSLVLPVSLSSASSSSSLFSCLRQLVHLCGHPSVCPLVYLHACVPACLSTSLAIHLYNSQMHCVYSSPSEWCIFWGNIKKTNLRLSSCGTDCFSASPFLTMILMNGSMKNVPWNSILM